VGRKALRLAGRLLQFSRSGGLACFLVNSHSENLKRASDSYTNLYMQKWHVGLPTQSLQLPPQGSYHSPLSR
jgi:hypothetical protein